MRRPGRADADRRHELRLVEVLASLTMTAGAAWAWYSLPPSSRSS
ncbi:MAG: hypothetical protein WKF76_08265 [Nocardioidaceae bacterium]